MFTLWSENGASVLNFLPNCPLKLLTNSLASVLKCTEVDQVKHMKTFTLITTSLTSQSQPSLAEGLPSSNSTSVTKLNWLVVDLISYILLCAVYWSERVETGNLVK